MASAYPEERMSSLGYACSRPSPSASSAEEAAAFESEDPSSASDADDEHSVICCSCDGQFETNLDLISFPENRLPFTCRCCFNCTCCFKCLRNCYEESLGEEDSSDNTFVTCPDCLKPGFDMSQLFPDRNVCTLLEALDAQRKRKRLNAPTIQKIAKKKPKTQPKVLKKPPPGGASQNVSLCRRRYKVGMAVEKVFKSNVYTGMIESVCYVPNYTIRYEDGSEEQLPESLVSPRMIASGDEKPAVQLASPSGATLVSHDERKNTIHGAVIPDVARSTSMPSGLDSAELGASHAMLKSDPNASTGSDSSVESQPPRRKRGKSISPLPNSTARSQETTHVKMSDDWESKIDLFFTNDSELPRTFIELLRIMDALLGEAEGIDFEKSIIKDKRNRSILRRRLSRHQGTYPNDPAISWHRRWEEWSPSTKRDLKLFIPLLIYMARSRLLHQGPVLAPSEEPSIGEVEELATKIEMDTKADSSLPRTFRGVLQLMDSLYGDEEGFSFEEEFHNSKTRNVLLDFFRKNPDHPSVSWKRPTGTWAPPDGKSLDLFMGLLLDLSRREGR